MVISSGPCSRHDGHMNLSVPNKSLGFHAHSNMFKCGQEWVNSRAAPEMWRNQIHSTLRQIECRLRDYRPLDVPKQSCRSKRQNGDRPSVLQNPGGSKLKNWMTWKGPYFFDQVAHLLCMLLSSQISKNLVHEMRKFTVCHISVSISTNY